MWLRRRGRSDEELVDNNGDFLPGIVGERGGTHETANSEQSYRMKDCCVLTKFDQEQKQLLEDMLQSLVSGEDEGPQARKMSALMVSMILQSLKGLDRFDSPMIHFAAVLDPIPDSEAGSVLGFDSQPEAGLEPGFDSELEAGSEPGFELELDPGSQLALQLQRELENAEEWGKSGSGKSDNFVG